MLRDDFDFGHLMLVDSRALESALASVQRHYDYAAFYALRLALSRQGKVVHCPELLYASEGVSGGGSPFDYVDPRNRRAGRDGAGLYRAPQGRWRMA